MRQILGRRPDDRSAALVAAAVLNAAREAHDPKAERNTAPVSRKRGLKQIMARCRVRHFRLAAVRLLGRFDDVHASEATA